MPKIYFPSMAPWLEARRQTLNASEIAAALYNLGYISPSAIVASKLEGLPVVENEAMRMGLKLEPIIAQIAEETLGLKYVQQHKRGYTMFRHPTIPILAATPDRVAVDPRVGRITVELKNVGQWNSAEWDEEPPLQYQIQCQAQMFCVGVHHGVLCALIGGQRFVSHRVTLNESFVADMAAKAVVWWQRHIIERQPVAEDPDAAAAARMLSLRHPDDDGLAIQLPYGAMAAAEQIRTIKDQIRALESQKAGIENLFKRALGPHTYGVLPDGGCVSWKTTERDGYYVKPSKTRVLRFSTKTPRRLDYVNDTEPCRIDFSAAETPAVSDEPRDTSDDGR